MKLLTLVLPLMLIGCGAVMSPFMIQLDSDQQKVVDGMWNNMLTPPTRLDRELLLDVLCEYQVLQMGADRVHITAEKYLANGRATLDADFDHANPEADQMTLIVHDSLGRTVRRERYFRREINARLPEINSELAKHKGPYTIALGSATQPSKPETSEETRLRLDKQKHEMRIQAATQPARVN